MRCFINCVENPVLYLVLGVYYVFMFISAWVRTAKREFSLPVSGQRLIMFFGDLIMSRIQNDVIAV